MDLIGPSIIGIVVGLIVAIALRRQKKRDTPEEDEEKILESQPIFIIKLQFLLIIL